MKGTERQTLCSGRLSIRNSGSRSRCADPKPISQLPPRGWSRTSWRKSRQSGSTRRIGSAEFRSTMDKATLWRQQNIIFRRPAAVGYRSVNDVRLNSGPDFMPIELSVENGIATIVFNRPERLNAFDPADYAALSSAFVMVRDNPAVRVALVTGA